ncbi:MAG: ATP-binding protein [Thermodesulfovibrionales bacterium]
MNHATLIFISLSFIVLILILAYILRAVFSLREKKAEEKDKAVTEVGFVVDTFHDVVSKLKEKERELEILRKTAEERASEIEIYNEDILQSVPSGVVSFDQKLCITRMNAAAEKILDCREGEIAGKGYEEVFSSPIREIIASRQTIGRTDTGYTTKSGKRIWLGLNMSPLKDSSGTVIGQILVFTDLTELKAFQSQMELRERLSNLGEMSAGIAHELRNPLAVISGYTKILSKKIEPSLLPAVEAISKEISVMDRIITDFLAFAKPTELVFTDVDLCALLETCIGALESGAKGIVIIKNLGAYLRIRADEVLLRQAINNLLQNAIEAMPDGGTLKVSVSSRPDSAVITVSDSGHSIPAELQAKIFLPFFTTKERGTGLGLSIVHKVVVSHGGTIRIDSGDGGTTFSVTLPHKTGT